MKPYLYRNGLKEIVQKIQGDERIHIGIRPYGFHAGNVTALISYPVLLCREFKEFHKKEPSFTFVYSINDWEQDALDGPDYKVWPFNIIPKHTTIKNLYCTVRPETSMADYWQDIIARIVNNAFKNFSNIKIEFFRNSELKSNYIFKNLLIETIKNPEKQASIYNKYSDKEILSDPIMYASMICPDCKSARNKTTVVLDSKFEINCENCNESFSQTYNEADFWWHHKPLLLARLAVYDIDITLSGGDHYSEGDFILRQAFIDNYMPTLKVPKMIFTPTILSPKDNHRMSKTYKNTYFVDHNKLTEFLDSKYEEKVLLDSSCIIDANEEEYENYTHTF